MNNLVVYAFENREKMLMTILEKTAPPPLNAPLKEAAPLNLTSTASLYAPNTIGNASSAIPTLCDNPATTTFLNPTFKGGNVAPTHHSFASTTTTIPLMYTHHQQPTLIQVGTGGTRGIDINVGENGEDSSITINGVTITAVGGGGGGQAPYRDGNNGGSG